MHGHTRTGSVDGAKVGRGGAGVEGVTLRILAQTHVHATPHARASINTRNHPGDNGRSFYRTLICTLLSSASRNHTIRKGGGGGVKRGGGYICDGGGREGTEQGSSQVHEMCEYVREMN